MEKDENSQINVATCDCAGLVALTKQTTLTELSESLLQTIGKILPESKITFSTKNTSKKSSSVNEFLGVLINDIEFVQLVKDNKLPQKISSELEHLIEVYINQYNMICRVNHDQLTKLGNRQALDQKFLDIFGLNNRRQKESDYCLAILDIDHFKQVNDTYGHLHGDEVLLQLSRLMLDTFRDIDFLFRFGGEEFVVILSDIQLNQAAEVLERFRKIVLQYEFPLVKSVTVSLGLTQINRESDALNSIARADKALYFAKDNGRNQLQVYENLIASGDFEPIDKQDDDITLF